MSDGSKKIIKRHPIPTDHPYLVFKQKDDRILTFTIKSEGDPEIIDDITEMCESNLTFEKKGKENIYLLKWKELASFLNSITCIINGEEEEEESSSSSTDDEMLQKALARRYKYQLSEPKKSLAEEQISDSEMEDPISISRRLRHLYNSITSLTKRVAELEANQKN